MNTQPRITQSQKIFNVLRSKRRTGAKLEDLTEATGLKKHYMGSYLAEFERVYGAKVEFNKDKKRYQLKNLAQVSKAFKAAKTH